MSQVAVGTTRSTVRVALFAALLVVLSLMPPIPLPGAPVFVTLQLLGVMLAGLLLGPRLGALACLLYVVLAAIGLPVLPGGRGGLGVLVSPTGGFLLGMIAAAGVIGLLSRKQTLSGRGLWAQWLQYFLACAVGVAVDYAIGIPWLAKVAGLSLGQASAAMALYVPLDLIKGLLAAWIGLRVRRLGVI